MLTFSFFHKEIPKNHTITPFQISYCPGKAEFPMGGGSNVLENYRSIKIALACSGSAANPMSAGVRMINERIFLSR